MCKITTSKILYYEEIIIAERVEIMEVGVISTTKMFKTSILEKYIMEQGDWKNNIVLDRVYKGTIKN